MRALARAVHAEARKLVTMPSVWVGAALTVLFPSALSRINAGVVRNALETGNPGSLISTDTTDIGLVDLVMGSAGVVTSGCSSCPASTPAPEPPPAAPGS